ncbi:MAG: MarR family transcriptional regulator [Chloroflexi bacterium AL-N10]|nr:MarR family transcriptional regulator [Chloroflexi bacterium AL-N1]NOK66700.1 MarR family transcriptional regulator [Chloroflexi bacterium AL-N10]NOK72088.1 MarR family transcriptional regulator [Chloroflexi bacterium AL-N5]
MQDDQIYNDNLSFSGADCVCFNLRKTARAVTNLYEQIMQPIGLRATQFTLLMVLKEIDEAVTISQLADVLVMDRTTLTRDLKPLERIGLLTVTVGADRRTRCVQLTEAGLQRLAEGLPLWEKAQQQLITQGIGLAHWQNLRQGLEVVTDIARQS